jgi:hypothetical protein
MFEQKIGSIQLEIEQLRSRDIRRLADRELEAGFTQLQRVAEMLEAERARWLAEIDRRRTFAADGHLSTTSWLIDRFGASGAAACQQVRVARALEGMPVSREALGSGEISSSAVRVLMEAKEEQPEAFSEAEARLVQAAKALTVRKLTSAVATWSRNVDARAAEEKARRLKERRRLSIGPLPSGMVRIDGELDPETGQVVMTSLRSVLDAKARSGPGDGRTPAQARADALGELCRQSLDRGGRPFVGRERPHLVVKLVPETLTGGGAPAELEEAGVIGTQEARRLACDASITRVVLRGSSEPLDLGRRTPVIPPAIRRAVVVRDQGCRFPGCDRPAPWCDAHHARHWADGGPTSISNLVLLCRPHHRMLHEGGFKLDKSGCRLVFRRPDGSVLEDRAPP